jgi:predicted transcriptional regulator
MPKTFDYPFIKEFVAKWPKRIAALETTQKRIANLAKITPERLNVILNFRTDNPKLSTIQSIENALRSLERAKNQKGTTTPKNIKDAL